MPNEIMIPKNFGQVPSVFANQPIPNDLGAGIVGGFGVVSIRGKAWRIKYRGEEETLLRPDGDGAVSYIDAIIVRAAPHLSKIYYERGYVEGSTDRPDCWSANGVTPDASVVNKQSPTCGNCPQNVWGSKVTPAGKPSKACADSKRLAIVPLHDIDNENYGGPMLLRIPPASLADVANYAQKMGSLGFPYYAIGTRIQFDVESEYPKLQLTALRALTEEEAAKVAELQNDPRMGRILSETGDFVPNHIVPEPEPQKIANPAPQPAAKAPEHKPEVATKTAGKPVSGFGAAQPKPIPAQATNNGDAGEIPEGLKRTPTKPKLVKTKVEEAVPETAPIADFDSMLDGLLS